MKCILCCAALCLLLLFASPLHAQDMDAEEIAQAASTWIETERETAQVPGVITALVAGGEVVMARGFGMADIDAARPADGTTRFRVGSISKPVTATAALLAMEEYGIDPDIDLRGMFTDLPIRPALEVPLTFRHLLTHAAGFSESLSGQHVLDPPGYQSLSDYLQGRLPPRFEEPGRIITYNDHNTALAGYAVERLSGESFPDYARERVFAPLGMTRSTFDQRDIVESEAAPLARSYHVAGDGYAAYAPDLIMTTPAAGLATTAADMGRYMEYLLSGAHPEQLAVQFENDPRLRGRAFGFVETRRGGHLVLYKDGQANGFGARMVLVPDLGLGVFVAVNLSVLGPMGAPNESSRFLRGYTRAVLEAAIPDAGMDHNPPVPLTGVDSAAFTGHYRTTVAARHTWEKLLAMTDAFPIGAREDGSITVGSGRYVPVGDRIYQWHEGGPYYVGFTSPEDGAPPYFIIGSGSYERVPWYGVQEGAGAILFTVGGIALFMVIGGGVLWRMGFAGAWTRLAMGGGALRIAFIGVLAGTLMLMDPQNLFYGMPMGVSVAVGLALGALALDGLAALAFVRAGRFGPLGTSAALIYFTSAAVFAWWLSSWNLLGWQTG